MLTVVFRPASGVAHGLSRLARPPPSTPADSADKHMPAQRRAVNQAASRTVIGSIDGLVTHSRLCGLAIAP